MWSCLYRYFITAAELHQCPVAGQVPNIDFLLCQRLLNQYAGRVGCCSKLSTALEYVGKGMAVRVNGKCFALARWNGNVQILGIRCNTINRTAYPFVVTNNDFNRSAIIVCQHRQVVGGNILVARCGHLQRTRQIGPQLKAVHLTVFVAVWHLLMQDAGACGHPLQITGTE